MLIYIIFGSANVLNECNHSTDLLFAKYVGCCSVTLLINIIVISTEMSLMKCIVDVCESEDLVTDKFAITQTCVSILLVT